ncbi:MAG: hypothetical protein R2878_08075 [Thermoleophilia bacterium]
MPTLTCLRRGVRLASLAVAASTCVTGAAVAAAPDGVPFAAGSPFNQLVPANPQIAGNSGNIDRALGLSNEFYTPAVYVSRPSDPLITIRLSWTPNPLDGVKVRVDPRAVPSSESDAHVTIVDTERDLVISLYQAKPVSGGVLQATSGGMASLSGNGANRADSSGGRESGISQLAGLITPDDVRRAVAKGEDGDLGHALAFVHHSVSNKLPAIAPALWNKGTSSDPNALAMGQRVFLDPAVNVSTLPCQGDTKQQRFCRILARTLQRYGAIAVTNSGNFNGFQMANPIGWTAVGEANPWTGLIGASRSGYYNFIAAAIPYQRMRALAGLGTPGPSQPGLSGGGGSSGGSGSSGGGGGTGGGGSSASPSTSTGSAGGVRIRVKRKSLVARGRVYVRVALTTNRAIRVRVRLRTFAATGGRPVRTRLVTRVLRPRRTSILKLRMSAARVGTAELGVWRMRSGNATKLSVKRFKVR